MTKPTPPKNSKDKPSSATAFVTPANAEAMEATQLGRFGTKGGTGFAAEDANALIDERNGKTVLRTGQDNAKNGADRIVDGVPVQTKYFDSANRTVNAAFDDSGRYRYGDMQLEVPKDQYDKAVAIMKEKIAQGNVPGVTDPEDAVKIIRKGNVTYTQAKNIAKAGNIDSLSYDARNSALLCSSVLGVSFAVEFAAGVWRGDSKTTALKNASLKGLQTSGLAFLASVGSAQLLRTDAARSGTVLVRNGLSKLAKTDLGKALIHKVAAASSKGPLYGAAAVNHVSKLLRSNVITGAVTFSVLALPDLYRASISGRASWTQTSKNLLVNASSIAGGTGGWIAGSTGGAALGSVVPVLGTAAGALVGGLVGSIGGGILVGSGSKMAMDALVDDDAHEMEKLLNQHLLVAAEDYLLSQQEFDRFVAMAIEVMPDDFLQQIYASPGRASFIYEHFSPYAEAITMERPKVIVPDDVKVLSFVAEMVDAVDSGKSLDDLNTFSFDEASTPVDPTAPAASQSTISSSIEESTVVQKKRAAMRQQAMTVALAKRAG